MISWAGRADLFTKNLTGAMEESCQPDKVTNCYFVSCKLFWGVKQIAGFKSEWPIEY